MKSSTRAGNAYVGVSVDGDGINEGIIEGFEGAGPAGREAGGEAGDGFSEEFVERLGRLPGEANRELNERMGEGSREAGSRTAVQFSSGLETTLADRLVAARRESMASLEGGDEASRAGDTAGNDFAVPFSNAVDRVVVQMADSIEEGLGGAGIDSSNIFSENFTGNLQDQMEVSGNEAFDTFSDNFASGAQTRADDAADDWGNNFGDRTSEAAGEAGDNAGESFVGRFGRWAESLGDRYVAHLQSSNDDAQASISDALDSDFGERVGGDLGDGIGGEMSARLNHHADRAGDDAGARVGSHMVASLRQRLEGTDDLIRSITNALLEADRSGAGDERIQALSHSLRSATNEATNLERQLRAVMESEGLIHRGRRERDSGGGEDDGGGERQFGSFLSGRSRNNFLHVLGKSIASMIKLTDKLTASFSGLFGSGGESAGMFAKIASTSLAAGASLTVVLVVVAALVTQMAALLAILIAMASTITTALAGAVLVLGGALTAAAAAAGLLTIAFTSMTKAQSDLLANAFQPLKAEVTGIGQLLLKDMVPAFATWSKNLQLALLPLAGFADRIGGAFARAGNIITASFSGAGFQALITALGDWLPRIITQLSIALGGFMNGLAGTFAAIMPFVAQFSRYLAEVGTRFSTWANSAGGQNAIVDFVSRAVESLKSLWDATREVFGFVFDVLFNPTAQAAGNTIFDAIAQKFHEFRDAFAQAAADGSLEKWFEDAINFGIAFYNTLASLGHMLVNLYNSGVLSSMGGSFLAFGETIAALNPILEFLIDLIGYALPFALVPVLAPLAATVMTLVAMAEALEVIGGWLNAITPGSVFGDGGELDTIKATLEGIKDVSKLVFSQYIGDDSEAPSFNPDLSGLKDQFEPIDINLDDLIHLGDNALDATLEEDGGYLKDPEWKNPYIAFADSLIASIPNVEQALRKAMRQMNTTIRKALSEASSAATVDAVVSALDPQIDALKNAGEQAVQNAQSALDSSATALRNASTAEAAQKALRQIKRDQKDLEAALAAQLKLKHAARLLNKQEKVTDSNVTDLLNGMVVANATLADYAAAREILATRIEDANQKLKDAIALRDNYASQVADGVRAFASILTASAKVINGVQQALTAEDITTNLRDRLQKIRDFQNNLHILLAQGISNAAYQQLVDAGVDQGGAYAEALAQGGQGAVQEVNELTADIADAAGVLGNEAASSLYDAGVAAAQGLLDGLVSLSDQLTTAGAALGLAIAQAIADALGLSGVGANWSPGPGGGGGGNNGNNNGNGANWAPAASKAVSPSLAMAYSRGQVPAAVSGNGMQPKVGQVIIHTPTEDPMAVAVEAVNEIVGRL